MLLPAFLLALAPVIAWSPTQIGQAAPPTEGDLSPEEIAELPPVRHAIERGEPLDLDGYPFSEYVHGELIVRYRPGTEPLARALHRHLGAEVLERRAQGRFELVRLPEWLPVAHAAKLYRGQPYIEHAERNWRRWLTHVPLDPVYSMGQTDQWALKRISCENAWNSTLGDPDVIIAVVDTGVDSIHDDLGGALVSGWNAYLNNKDTEDSLGHGTAVALIAAANNNQIGCVGVAPGCRIMPIKMVNEDNQGDSWAASEGIEWAADHGADVINMSFTSYGWSLFESNAVSHAWNRGCVLVAAAGNDGVSTKTYPASLPNVIAVGGTKYHSDARWGLSNHGSWVDVAAPAVAVAAQGSDGDIFFMQGTSFAAPLVSGEAALVFPLFSTNSSVVNRILNRCDPVSGGNWVEKGRINVHDALSGLNMPVNSSFGPCELVPGETFELVGGNIASLERGLGTNKYLVTDSVSSFTNSGSSFPPNNLFHEDLEVVTRTSVQYPGTLQRIDIVLEGLALAPMPLTVKLYNFKLDTWITLGTMNLTTMDTVATFSQSSSPIDFLVGDDVYVMYTREATGWPNPPAPFRVYMDLVRVTMVSK